MAQVWLHNEMLQVEGKKMSKSLGNFFTVRDLLDQGVPGEVIRFVMLSTHYRKPMDWTEKKRDEAEKALDTLARALRVAVQFGVAPSENRDDLPQAMLMCLNNDLDTWGARIALVNQAELLLKLDSGDIVGGDATRAAIEFVNGLNVLGLFELVLQRQAKMDTAPDILEPMELKMTLIYNFAKQNKDFSEVDRLKSALVAAGVEVRMSKAGVELLPGPGFDPAKLEGLE
jgi:cysteinyl-tRNA synthetase